MMTEKKQISNSQTLKANNHRNENKFRYSFLHRRHVKTPTKGLQITSKPNIRMPTNRTTLHPSSSPLHWKTSKSAKQFYHVHCQQCSQGYVGETFSSDWKTELKSMYHGNEIPLFEALFDCRNRDLCFDLTSISDTISASSQAYKTLWLMKLDWSHRNIPHFVVIYFHEGLPQKRQRKKTPQDSCERGLLINEGFQRCGEATGESLFKFHWIEKIKLD